jgi:hypothetical protein
MQTDALRNVPIDAIRLVSSRVNPAWRATVFGCGTARPLAIAAVRPPHYGPRFLRSMTRRKPDRPGLTK